MFDILRFNSVYYRHVEGTIILWCFFLSGHASCHPGEEQLTVGVQEENKRDTYVACD